MELNGERFEGKPKIKRITLITMFEERTWDILNGNKEGDQEGDYTHIGQNWTTTINYGIENEDVLEKIAEFIVENSIEADYLVLKTTINGLGTTKGTRSKKEEEKVQGRAK